MMQLQQPPSTTAQPQQSIVNNCDSKTTNATTKPMTMTAIIIHCDSNNQ